VCQGWEAKPDLSIGQKRQRTLLKIVVAAPTFYIREGILFSPMSNKRIRFDPSALAPQTPESFPPRLNYGEPQIEDKHTKRSLFPSRTTSSSSSNLLEGSREPENPYLREVEKQLPEKLKEQKEMQDLQEVIDEAISLHYRLETTKGVLKSEAKKDKRKEGAIRAYLAYANPDLLKELFPEEEKKEEPRREERRKWTDGKKKAFNWISQEKEFLFRMTGDQKFSSSAFEAWKANLEDLWNQRKDEEVGAAIEKVRKELILEKEKAFKKDNMESEIQ
jgi:hypothetical protein